MEIISIWINKTGDSAPPQKMADDPSRKGYLMQKATSKCQICPTRDTTLGPWTCFQSRTRTPSRPVEPKQIITLCSHTCKMRVTFWRTMPDTVTSGVRRKLGSLCSFLFPSPIN